MVQTRSQVHKSAQPLLLMHVSLSSDDNHTSQGFSRDDSSSPNSSRHHHQLPHLSEHQVPQPHIQGAPVQQHPGAATAHHQAPQPHTQPLRPTTGAALSVTHSSRSSHRGRYSSSVGSQKRPYPSPGSPTIRPVPRNTPSLSMHSSSPEQFDKKMKASKSLRVSHWITLNDIVTLI
ncbi:hypothetical protein V6N11_084013 [Hibiscus sabdariffa]|uniref:Uncharacterized protein n=1 Tax=Hibiscus sabdariffa TaxID=183260 RepID=A0ABR2QDQ7_9ROSI